MPTFTYDTAPVKSFQVRETDEKGNVKLMEVNDRLVEPTDRFWTSLCSNFSGAGMSKKLFNLFSHEEVFGRLSQRFEDSLGLTIAEYDDGASAKLLAVRKANKPIAKYDDVINVLNKYDGEGIKYQDGGGSSNCGIVQSWHTPPRMENFELGGDKFIPKFVCETPIDGFGKPLIYLSMLRQVCTNGMIGYSRAFRSELSLGKNDEVMFSLERALDSYSNEEGYMALRQRMETAQNSWASISECHRIAKTLSRMAGHFQKKNGGSPAIEELSRLRVKGWDGAEEGGDLMGMRLQKAFSQVTGDLCHIYGLVQLDSLSRKKMATLPTRATVYDLMNFATEVATHYADETAGRAIQADIGSLLGDGEYDLENSCDECATFADWQIATDDEQDAFRAIQEEQHGDLLD